MSVSMIGFLWMHVKSLEATTHSTTWWGRLTHCHPNLNQDILRSRVQPQTELCSQSSSDLSLYHCRMLRLSRFNCSRYVWVWPDRRTHNHDVARGNHCYSNESSLSISVPATNIDASIYLESESFLDHDRTKEAPKHDRSHLLPLLQRRCTKAGLCNSS